MKTDGDYFDGRSSVRHRVTLTLDGNDLRIEGAGIAITWPLAEIRISAPLGAVKSSLYLPDGGKCDFANRDFARLAERSKGRGGFFRGVHRWENSLRLAFVALALTVVLVLGFIKFGLPFLAEQAAYAIPPATETALGAETLQILDKALFSPSGLDTDRRSELQRLFAEVVATLDAAERPYQLELRSSARLGANALALPGGTVILTDELTAIAETDEEIAAVLAHEVGHVRHRHAMRQVIQSSAVGLMIATLTGDLFSAASMAAALPTMLVDADFSRDMERQADDVAVEYLTRKGETPDHFASILTRIEEAHAGRTGQDDSDGSGITDYFSSHPPTGERIARLRGE
jgi:Zn-dependent protease with chaperone function